jgi:aminodeoxyfutalosine deaminase
VRARALLQVARGNSVPLPRSRRTDSPGSTSTGTSPSSPGALRTERDFRQVVADHAAEAASHGAVYTEGIFTPAEPAARGCDWDEVFEGYCDGAQQAAEQHGVRTGRQAEAALLDAWVVTNRNSVPGDPNGAWYTCGIREA